MRTEDQLIKELRTSNEICKELQESIDKDISKDTNWGDKQAKKTERKLLTEERKGIKIQYQLRDSDKAVELGLMDFTDSEGYFENCK